MFSPADGWEDVENGYQTGGGAQINIQPLKNSVEDGVRYTEAVDDADNAERWELVLWYNDSYESIAQFEDSRTAWEFANCLTHHISFLGARQAKDELKEHQGGGGLPKVIQEGRDGEEVYREALGGREYMLDNALDESD